MYIHTCVHMYLVTCVVHTTCFSNINKFNGQVTSLSVVYIPWYTYMWYIHVCTHEAHTTYYIHVILYFTWYTVYMTSYACMLGSYFLFIYLQWLDQTFVPRCVFLRFPLHSVDSNPSLSFGMRNTMMMPYSQHCIHRK